MKKENDEPKTKKKARGWFVRNAVKLIMIFVAIAGLSLVDKIPKKNKETAASDAPAVNVEVMNVTLKPEFTDTFRLPAVVEPNRIVTVSAEIDGRIENIPVTDGSDIKKGDLLVRLNTEILLPQYKMTEAQLQRDEIEYTRMANLVKNDATPKSDFDNAKTKLDISKAQFEEIKAKLERASIVAPISGVLNKVSVKEGEYIQPGTPVVQIVDNDIIKVAVDIPERDISFFTTGGQAEVIANYKGKEEIRKGTITFISELADELTRSTRMEISLPNKDRIMHSGQIVNVILTRQVLKDVIMIPLSAVIPMENGNAVYIANSTVAKRRDVQIGIIKGDEVQIKSGLSQNDQLIISGHRLVVPNQTISIPSEK